MFGEVADTYDRHRPSYPDALVERVLSLAAVGAGDVAVEVGCGTGKATELFAGRGMRVEAVEPSAEMAVAARRRLLRFGDAVRIEHSFFEEWTPPPGGVPLLYAAQSWHWVPEEVRAVRAAAALRPGGWLALFWNRLAARDDDVRAALDEAYARAAPDLVRDSANRIPSPGQAIRWRAGESPAGDELDRSGLFGAVVVEHFPWSRWYPTDDYIELLSTYSDHRMLPPETLKNLQAAVAAALNRHRGGIEHSYIADLVAAPRLPH